MKAVARSHARSHGFSLIELVMVCAVMVCVAAFAFPVITTTLARVKLRTTMGELSGMVQNCRSLAVRKDKTRSVHSAVVDNRLVFFTQICEGAGCSANMAGMVPGEDKPLYLPAGFSIETSGPATFDTTTNWGNSVSPATTDITYNSRGIPCDLGTYPCSGPKGFVQYLKYVSAGQSYWIALTVSPAGRVKVYYWNDSGKWGD